MTVTFISSGKVYPGELVNCTGIAKSVLITSDGFGTASKGGLGTYVVNQQLTSGPVQCTGAEPDIGGGGSPISNFYIFNCNALAFQPYNPVPGAAQNSNTCAGSTEVGIASTIWGAEGGFINSYLANNPKTTVYLIKGNIGGTGLCPQQKGLAWAPAFAMIKATDLQLYNGWVRSAYAALANAGVANYSIGGVLWAQGEHDAQDTNPPHGCNAWGNGNNVYYDNLVDLIDVVSIPRVQNFAAAGSISGDLVTVTGTPGGIIRPGENVTGAGLPPLSAQAAIIVEPYGSACWNGAANVTATGTGGAGSYCIEVEQIPAELSGALTDSNSGASVAAGAFRFSGRSLRIDATTGVINVGDRLSCSGCLAGAYVTKLYDYYNGVGDVGTNVSLSIPSESLNFRALGWGAGGGKGTGVGSSKWVVSEVQSTASGGNSANRESDGPSRAQEAISGQTISGVHVTTIQRWDLPLTGLHDEPAVLIEEGRRIYEGYVGACDYRTPTC